ncbi:hypothetical protein HYC85_026264 [Camellia sinensis]|uniref:Major facilitator superfamily (MFS) profile domain-containing protein n=1 Tax=Camellia sinensis TaxID=4442 RepID=A0A7J7G4C6_CAMSI|nr:hypothetical protein HYC85_026264 [Camellia sinensis]
MEERSSDPVKTTSQPVSRRKGGLRTMPFVIANEALEKVASVGLHANMILYLKNEYHLSIVTGTSILFLWNAVSNFLPTFGAFLSDSYLGRFRVVGLGSVVTLLCPHNLYRNLSSSLNWTIFLSQGLVVLWFTAIFKHARPPHCDHPNTDHCASPKPAQLALLFSSFVLMAIGAGGIRPCSLAFGADQFNKPDNPKNTRVLQTFFNWYYVSLGISIMISVTVIVYIQTAKGWTVGFGVPVVLMFFSTVMFFLGSPLYVKVKANKSLLTGFAQVMAVSWKNKHLDFPPKDSDGQYHHKKGSKLLAPAEKLRFLNKACIIKNPEKDLNPDGTALDPWTLCTVQQVEELKALIKVLPIWSAGIIIAVTISQQAFPVLQAYTMDRHINKNFKMPPGSYGVFSILTLTIWVAIYDRLIVPWLSKYTKRPRGLSLKQRMGIGLFLSCIATAVAALIERTRRARAINEGLADQPDAVVNMSAMWLVPQHCLVGISEAFNAIGQIQFYYSQFPKSMSSIGIALFTLGMGVGNLWGSFIVSILAHATKRGGNPGAKKLGLERAFRSFDFFVRERIIRDEVVVSQGHRPDLNLHVWTYYNDFEPLV